MQKRLTPQQQQQIIDVATHEFGKKGFHATNINDIAAGAGVSVGVIYKYYADKRALFDACLNAAVAFLDNAMETLIRSQSLATQYMTPGNAEQVISICLELGEQEPDKLRMYHMITTNRSGFDDAELARRIESASAEVYKKNLREAQCAGLIRADVDPDYFSMILDQLIMFALFSVVSPYYRERFAIFCGGSWEENKQKLITEMAKFLRGALGKCSEESPAAQA